MTNAFAVCLTVLLLGIADQASARQLGKECTKGPEYWCQSLSTAASCGAVGHCTTTEWEQRDRAVRPNDVSDQIVRLFRQLKDVKDLINEDYLATRVESACKELRNAAAAKLCRDNTAYLQTYLTHVLRSKATPETMCRVVGMCNSDKLDNVMSLAKKSVDIPKKPSKKPVTLLGGERCTWGPSYWCSNISTGHECKATHHCIERVWSKMEVAEDTDSVCKICTDMVKQARDQLESNETQEELKQVFEGSCRLIPIKLVTKECMKLADEFIPDLVETLASQMNPQVVCSVAGLCNNAAIDRALEKYESEKAMRADCAGCHRTVGVLRKRYDAASYEDFLQGLLTVCRKADSLSDSCSMLVFKYYEDIRAAAAAGLEPRAVCGLAGSCVYQQHQHDDFDFPSVDVGMYKASDDVPCEFCEQLVTHFRDVMVANTTALEFYKVLKGLCKQTGKFSTECLALVEQYYPVVYNYLTSDIKPKEVCALAGICGPSEDAPLAPLLPRELAVKVLSGSALIGADERKIDQYRPAQHSVTVLGAAPLPLERMFVRMPQSKTACSFCQYFLHYVQVEISDEKNEEVIRETVEKACDHLPRSVEGECRAFVTQYGPAVIALVVQEIDPASVCPALGVCPQTGEVRRAPPAAAGVKSNCPLCLFAVEQLETMLKNNRTEDNIRHSLEHLCTHLSDRLRSQCVDFVDQYAGQLVEMLVADLDAQEICVYLKLCSTGAESADPLRLTPIDRWHARPAAAADRNSHRAPLLPASMLVHSQLDGDIETNEIPDRTVNGRPVAARGGQKTMCVICEFVMTEIDSQVKDKNNEDQIKKVVHNICKHMPKSVRGECDQFVEKYADLVISLLAQDLAPGKVCAELRLCDPTDMAVVKEAVLDCAVCEAVVAAVRKVLESDRVDRNIVHVVEKSCALLPAKYNDRCHTMLEIYGDSVIHLIETEGAKVVCGKIGLCGGRAAQALQQRYDNY